MSWEIKYTNDANNDLAELDGSQKKQVLKAVRKVSENPLSSSDGGYGKPLGTKQGRNLTGLLKIKLVDLGIRVVYRLIRTETNMQIIVIAARSDDEVYEIAAKRTN